MFGLIAIGYTMVYGILGMVNFAHGEIFMIGGFVSVITFLILGYQSRIVATVMAIFTVAAAFRFHRNFADQNAMAHFLKNISITGGLLQIAAFGAGSFSLDGRLAKSKSK